MAIKISRNEAGNCINFFGSSNPTYWNACLSGEVDTTDSNAVNIINDVITSQTGVTEYEFFRIPYTEFVDREGNSFSSAQETADYITTNANVIGSGTSGIELTDTVVCFKLDDTSTSIMLDNGTAYGVNTIKAIAHSDGTIHIISEIGDLTHYTKLDHTNVCINEVSASGGLNDVVNALNELFQVGAFEQVVISDPYSTMVADVNGVDTNITLGGNAIDPSGNDIAGSTSSGYNNAGVLTTETINQAGEYFTFDIRGEGIIGFGLVHTDINNVNGNTTYGDPSTWLNGINSGHYGYQFSHWFHPTPNGSWTNYGANTSYSMRSGWSSFPNQQNWLDGNPIKMRVGIDSNGFISIESYDPSTSLFVPHSRSSYPVADGVDFKLGIKFGDVNARLYSTPKVHLLEEEAPTMYFRYIESPDGVFHYPLFATAEEAEYYDEIENGASTGASHTHTYNDDPTNTTWYMPTAIHDSNTMEHTSAPSGVTFLGNAVTYTEITSLTNSDLTPAQFTSGNYMYEEGTVVNLQLAPQDVTYTTSVDISPAGSGLVFSSGYLLQGTLADVGQDTVYTITVTRANSYGSSVGSFTITSTDETPVSTMVTSWDKALDFSGSNEHLLKVNNWSGSNALLLDSVSQVIAAPTTAGNTANATNARPFATAIVFKYDGNNSNQHIWNSGEGAGSTDDNIYLRLDSLGYLHFGWGRSGAINECKFLYLGTGTNTNHWHGIYIAHNGTRLSGSNATAANLAACFDIRWFTTNYTGGVFGSWMDNKSTAANWTAGQTGGRMDRGFTGNFTVGGRGSNRNFHGKVASMVVTGLRLGVAMPTDAEINLMVTDPLKWEDDYRVGQTVRRSQGATDVSYANSSVFNGHGGTQIWLMGDGTLDSYANGIRNQVYAADQNYGKLQLNSMVSNDIQNVTISGLS